MQKNINDIINFIIPDKDIRIVPVYTNEKIDISKYTDNNDIINEYNEMNSNDFYGLFIIPGSKDFFTILLNKKIYNTNRLYNTLLHELFHCLFYINNKKLLVNEKNYLSYKVCDEMYARFKGLQIGYEMSLYDEYIFEEQDTHKIEQIVSNRIQTKTTWYEFICLFANMWFVKKVRNLDVDFSKAFPNVNQQELYDLICLFENIDFGNIDEYSLITVTKIISNLF